MIKALVFNQHLYKVSDIVWKKKPCFPRNSASYLVLCDRFSIIAKHLIRSEVTTKTIMNESFSCRIMLDCVTKVSDPNLSHQASRKSISSLSVKVVYTAEIEQLQNHQIIHFLCYSRQTLMFSPLAEIAISFHELNFIFNSVPPKTVPMYPCPHSTPHLQFKTVLTRTQSKKQCL